ncbi:DUF308 domain-containing protein [Mucilaginibacter sp. CAU 1740]|uniref:DUF308 domain-containing protein n=1 Tax=Mucilaginibacter sp. CAU 1740 TaxID=3140365 RepID=UPI00325BD167
MALIFMPRKSAMILLIILGIICLVDGIYKGDTTETIVGVVILLYAVVSLVSGRKKKSI